MITYKKPLALLDIQTDNHGVIAASAGTGKTYTLQHLVVEILLDVEEVRLDEILLVTFTVAATSDLKAKIRQTLQMLIEGWELARSKDLDVALLEDNKVSAWDADEIPDGYWTIDLDAVNRLRHALRNFDRAAIYTIHGFCQRILVEHAFANRRLFEQEHVSEDDVIVEAFAELLREEIRPGTEEEQWLTAYLGAGNDVDNLREILADYVQASGEYRPVESVDLDAFSRFVDQLVPMLESIDPDDWKESVKSVVRDADGPTVRTSNAVGDRIAILKEEFLPRVEPGNPVANLFCLNQVFRKKFDYFEKDDAQIVLDVTGDVGAVLTDILDFHKNCKLLVVARLGDLLAERVATLKSREGYFTFADMVRVVRDTLENEEDGQLLENIRSQFRYGLIDEFQDTDREQWDIFQKVFVESPAEDRHFLYLIGDPKQAIYGFRGGDVYTYLDACDRLRDLDAAETALTDNYRSTKAVLGACNSIFDSTIDESITLGDRIGYEKCGVSAGKPWLSLHQDGQSTDVGMTAFSLTTSHEDPKTAQVRNGLVDQYAEEIQQLIDGTRRLSYNPDESSDELTDVGAGDIYVLCRRRADLHATAQALRTRGVPFAFLKMPGLFQTPEASDVYDLLLAVDDPYDRSRRARAWMTPFFDLTLSHIEGLAEIDERQPIFEKLLEWSRRARDLNFSDLFNQILTDSGLIRRRLLLERGERELTNYLHIFELLADEGNRRVHTIEELAARLKSFMDGRSVPDGEDAEQQRLETEESAVQLLTIHASKGLQRGVVFVVPKLGSVSKNPPMRFHEPQPDGDHIRVEWHDRYSTMSGDEKDRYVQEATAEELRLAYVALTRAELMVYVPWIDQNSPIRDNYHIDNDPFMQIVDRMATIADDDELSKFIDFRPTTIDVAKPQPTDDEITSSLQNLEPFDGQDLPEPDPEVLRQTRRKLLVRRWEVTSYTKLKQRVRTSHTTDEKGDGDAPTGILPGGMATGNFIHLVLEKLDYQLVDEFERPQWLDDDDLRQLFSKYARRFGRFDDDAIAEAMGLVYDTLKAPITLADDTSVDGVRRLDPDRVRREVEFLFPVPEVDADGQWHRNFRSGAQIKGGFVTGIVDLLFEHDGKLYFADWKSDRAHPYDSQSIDQLIEERYSTQANLYTLALCRMLGVEDRQEYDELFGGYFYFFVRGMKPHRPERGIYSGRVDWTELVDYERSLSSKVRQAKVEELGEEVV